jgi:hypothetical protein
MKTLLSVLAVVAVINMALADVPDPRRSPSPPRAFEDVNWLGQGSVLLRMIPPVLGPSLWLVRLPFNLFGNLDRPPVPGRGPANLPETDKPGPVNDRP